MHMEHLIQAQAAAVPLIQPALPIPEVVAVVVVVITLKAATVALEWSLSVTPIHLPRQPQRVAQLLPQLLDTEFIHLPVLAHLLLINK
jgi:hypothetical protein